MELSKLTSEFLPIIQEYGTQLWDGPADTALMQNIAEVSAALALQAAKGRDVSADFEILKEAVRQRAFQKTIKANGISEDTFFKILTIIVRVAKTLI